ncbi:hypothetical protein OG874_28900 [Nocardia sp. NBC_00565]|uniref:hypothetical protein n=1 Tax=Nocardia sp. NBC_00565 TaxID=2975993 RepID=UPI002E8221D6|nr:hypothetical protein [Nocardia sp. NBC_00565]WUC00843.1 hypothetical protein OG874_28900 [Nocardia sp. NBC_00565]
MTDTDRAARHGRLLTGLLRVDARPSEIRWRLVELSELNASVTECAGRVEFYSRMLVEGRSTAAGHAQSVLAELHAAGLFASDEVVSLSREVLARTEKKLLRAQLSWLDRTVRSEPGCASAAVRALAEAVETTADIALRERMERMITRHLRSTDEQTRTDLAAAATAWQIEDEPPLPPPAAPAPFGVPTTVAETAELYRWVTASHHDNWLMDERFLDGVIRFAYLDRAGLSAALGPLADDEIPAAQQMSSWWQRQRQRRWCGKQPWSMGTLAAIATGALRSPPRGFTRSNPLLDRMAEWGSLVLEGAVLPPFSLATPTFDTGQIDAAELVERLREYAELGLRPGAVDFAQALVRVTPTARPEVLLMADALPSPEGERLAAWLRNEHSGAQTLPDYFSAAFRGPPPSARRYSSPMTEHLLPIPEVQAAWMSWTNRDKLLRIVALSGTKGEQVHRAVMNALVSEDNRDRTAGVEALLVLAAADELRPHLLAEALPVRAPANRLASSLRDARHVLGAHRTWPVLAAILPVLFANNPTPGLPEVVTLAADCARRSGTRGHLPGLDAILRRGGSSRLAKQARALSVALSSP